VYDNAPAEHFVEAQRKVRRKKGLRQKHRYVGTQSKGWTVLSALCQWIRPNEEVVDAHGRRSPMSLAPRLY
jgi:hypothetical protein